MPNEPRRPILCCCLLGVLASVCAGQDPKRESQSDDAADLTAQVQKYAAILGEAQEALDNKKPEMARSKLLSTDPKLRGWEFEYLLRKSKEERVRRGLPGKLEGRVSRMKFADNERVVLARRSSECESGEVSIWDIFNEKVTPLDFPPGYYIALAVSRDGNLIAAAGRTGKVTVWDLEKGKIVQQYSGHNPDPEITSTSREFLRVRSLAFSPDGKRIVSSAAGASGVRKVHALKVWSIETGKDLITIAGEHQGEKSRPILSVCLSPDGKMIASGGFDGAITLWDAESGKELRKIRGPLISVLSLEFSPDSRRLACGSANSAIWDVATGKRLVPLVNYRKPVASITFSPDGKRLVTGGWDKTVRIWDAGTGVQLLLLETLGNYADSVTMSPDGKSIAAGGPQGRAIPKPIMWSIRTDAAAQNSGDDNAAAKPKKDVEAAYAWAKKKLAVTRSTQLPHLRGNPSLPLARPITSLILFNVSVNDEELKHLAAFPKLKQLALSGKGMTDDGLKHLLTLKELERLSLSNSSISDAGMKHLATLQNLKRLELAGVKLTGAGIRELAGLPHLQDLSLIRSGIDDQALKDVGELKELRELNLRKTKISDEGLKHLAMMPELRELILQSTAITAEGLRHLAPCKSLRLVYCWGTDVTNEETHQLKEIMPNCKVDKVLIE